MPTVAQATRLLGYLMIGAALLRLSIALATDEGVNANGFVPGVGLGYLLAAIGGLALIAARKIRDRDYGRLAAVIALMLWLAASTYLFLSLPPGSFRGFPMGAIIGMLVGFGVIGTMYAALLVLVIVPAFSALAWLLDRIPLLRRHGLGNQIRRQLRSKL